VRAAILERSLADRRRSTVWWAVGIAAYTLVNVAVYPAIKSQASLNDIIKEYPPALMALFGIDASKLDLTSSVGYLSSQMNLFGPLLLLMVGVAFGASTVAGEEEAGTLGLLLSYPVTRTRTVVEKAVALVVVVTAVGLGLFAAILAGRLFQLDIPLGGMVAFCGSCVLLGVLFGALALAVGAGTGSKALATGTAAVMAAATYLLNSLSPVVTAFKPFRGLSPFWWGQGGNPLANGLALKDLAALVATSLVFMGLAAVVFNRRDLRS
jgi:ABC-2 type transport system permease protein